MALYDRFALGSNYHIYKKGMELSEHFVASKGELVWRLKQGWFSINIEHRKTS